jgi:hypothetical protein
METLEENKKLHLVYDEWGGNTPLPNLKESAGNSGFNFLSGFLDFYERFYFEQLKFDRYSFPIEFIKLTDIKNYSNKKLFYSIKTAFGLRELIEEKNFHFKESIIRELKENPNFYFLFVREHESETLEDLESLIKYFDEQYLPKEKIYLISNNPLLKKRCDEVGITFYKLNLLSLTSCSVFSELGSSFIEEKTGKFGICFNKSPKIHRYSLLVYLKNANLLEYINWSLIGKTEIDEDNLSRYFSENKLSNLAETIEYFNNLPPKFSIDELDSNWVNPITLQVSDSVRKELNGAGGASGGLMLPEPVNVYENSYINLITESMFENTLDTIHVTEKSFRPFYFYQIPMILATPGHISYMKNEYGFDFYDDFIDHSYDTEYNQINRMQMYTDEVFRLFSNKEEVKKYYKSNKKRFENNKKIVENLPNDTRDYLFFKSLLT